MNLSNIKVWLSGKFRSLKEEERSDNDNSNGDNIDSDREFLDKMFTVQQNHKNNIHAPITLNEM